MKKKLFWLAVQPTPYNSFLYKHINASEKLDFKLYYSQKQLNILPWKTSFESEDAKFFKRSFGVDWGLLKKAIGNKNTLFVVAGWNDLTKLSVLLIRRLLGKPFAIWTDSVSLDSGFKFKIKRMFLSFILNKADKILTTGEYGIERFKKSGLAPKNNSYINLPYFVPIPNIHPKKKPKGPVKFLCAGRLVKRKGYDQVIQSLYKCVKNGQSNFILNISGTGPEENKLKSLSSNLNISEKVNFLGWKEPEELELLRNDNDVFIQYVPTPDPFPVAVLEAMAYCMPVIGSDIAGSVVERVENGKSGFIIEANNSDKLFDCLSKIISKPEIIKPMSRTAQKKAKEWDISRGVKIVEGLVS